LKSHVPQSRGGARDSRLISVCFRVEDSSTCVIKLN
jgi:hypothetical protein